MIALFFKAQMRGDTRTGDLFVLTPEMRPISGYTDKRGRYHPPTQGVRHVGAPWHAGMARRGFNILGDEIARDFRERGAAALVGKTVRSRDDLAALAQVLRSPRYETCRYIFTKDDVVVGAMAVSSREVARSAAFPDKLGEQGIADWINGQADKLGATGIWMLHNHPSGRPTPSQADIVLTQFISKGVRRLRGHVVIDHTQYGYIPAGPTAVGEVFDLAHPNLTPDPALPHEMLGKQISSAADVAQIAETVKNSGARIHFIGASASLKVRAIMDTSPLTFADKAKTMAILRRFKRQTGSNYLFAANVPGHLEQLGRDAMRAGVLQDVLVGEGSGPYKVLSETTVAGVPPMGRHIILVHE